MREGPRQNERKKFRSDFRVFLAEPRARSPPPQPQQPVTELQEALAFQALLQEQVSTGFPDEDQFEAINSGVAPAMTVKQQGQLIRRRVREMQTRQGCKRSADVLVSPSGCDHSFKNQMFAFFFVLVFNCRQSFSRFFLLSPRFTLLSHRIDAVIFLVVLTHASCRTSCAGGGPPREWGQSWGLGGLHTQCI